MVQQRNTSPDEIGGLRKYRGGRTQKYVLDDHGRQLILNKYDSSTESLDELEQALQVPRKAIMKWAQQLGVARQKEANWTPEEDAYIERNLHRASIEHIAKKLGRTKTAIILRAKRLGINKCYQEGYTLSTLCMALGCTQYRANQWIELGWLKGKKRHTERENDIWYFTDRDIRNLVIRHPGEIDQSRVDWIWIVDILAGDEYSGLGSFSKDYAQAEK